MARKGSGTGQGGKSFQDRELAADVRREGLNNVKLVLTDDPKVNEWSDFKKQMVLRLAPGLLPKLNEHSGEGGGPISVEISEAVAKKNGLS